VKILLTILLFLSFSNADEMSRIESIVSDITQLRSKYDECKEKLIIKENNNTLYKRIEKLEKELKNKDNLLKSKENIIKKLKKSRKKKEIFPKLMMKDKVYQEEELVRFKATSYRLKYDSIIYHGINGKMITEWVKSTSFTSSVKTKNWIKVTGYFVNKKWIPSKKDMWIKISQVEKK